MGAEHPVSSLAWLDMGSAWLLLRCARVDIDLAGFILARPELSSSGSRVRTGGHVKEEKTDLYFRLLVPALCQGSCGRWDEQHVGNPLPCPGGSARPCPVGLLRSLTGLYLNTTTSGNHLSSLTGLCLDTTTSGMGIHAL